MVDQNEAMFMYINKIKKPNTFLLQLLLDFLFLILFQLFNLAYPKGKKSNDDAKLEMCKNMQIILYMIKAKTTTS